MTWFMIMCMPALILMLAFTLLSFKKDRNRTYQHHSPKVAVLLAARNEQENIGKCLAALAKLSYPAERIQILVGDDHSEDKTGIFIQEFIQDKPQFEYHLISDKKYGLKAKANVLQQLTEKSDADYYFITDADIEVPTHWIQNMLKQFDEDTGVVTGVTSIRSHSLLSFMQNLDWLFALGLAHFLSLVRFPVTCMGNNMAVKREAYDAVGGYKEIGFSVTEDFHLFRALLDKGWGFKNLFSKGVLAYSQPIKTWSKLLEQRKRWIRGGMSYSILKVMPLLVFSLFYVGVIVVGLEHWSWAGGGLLAMAIMKLVLAANAFRKIGQEKLVIHFFAYEIYCFLIMLSMVLYYPFSGKVKWKERDF